MSIELERLMSDVSDAGIVFIVRGGLIASLTFRKGKPSDTIMMRIKASKSAIEGYLRSNYSATRCFQCEHEARCQDKTDCVFNKTGLGVPPGIGSSSLNFSSHSHRAHCN